MAWVGHKRPISGRREGSIGTIIYAFFFQKKKKDKV